MSESDHPLCIGDDESRNRVDAIAIVERAITRKLRFLNGDIFAGEYGGLAHDIATGGAGGGCEGDHQPR